MLDSLHRRPRSGSVAPLLARGHAYFEAFGEDGDRGVGHPEWGTGFMSADWLASQTSVHWSLKLSEPARIDINHDLVVLVRNETAGAP